MTQQAPADSKHRHRLDRVYVRGARENNLKNVDLEIPREALVVFTGVSGSGKTSLAFGTIFAESQRRYLDSVAPYARRLIQQVGVPNVDSIDGLPPAVALQQPRAGSSGRSSVGSLTTVSNSLRMLYSRAGTYPAGRALIQADGFSANTPAGACANCDGLGRTYDATASSMVPNPNLTIRERAVAAWPGAWHGQNLREILTTLGVDIDVPWADLPEKDRHWILFTDEQPVVPVYAGLNMSEAQEALTQKRPPSYMGTFTSARRHVLHTFANSPSIQQRKRASRYLVTAKCAACDGQRLQRAALAVTFAGMNIADMSQLSIREVAQILAEAPTGDLTGNGHPEQVVVAQRICQSIVARLDILMRLGLGYLTLARSIPSLSPGELQRLRLATQISSKLFGVVYVLDEPSAGLHPDDTQALVGALKSLREAGNSLFLVEHNLDVISHADWVIDVGPSAGDRGGEVVFGGPLEGLAQIENSATRPYVWPTTQPRTRVPRAPAAWLNLRGVCRNNISDVDIDVPLGVLTTVTGISGSGKSSLIGEALVELLGGTPRRESAEPDDTGEPDAPETARPTSGRVVSGGEHVRRLVCVDQRAIGRTPRSNLATYTGLFGRVRTLFAATPAAVRRGFDAGQFSFNVAKGRCGNCQGEGFVSVELLFLPSVYTPCPLCEGSRYSPATLEVQLRGKTIADVLSMTVERAFEFFVDDRALTRSLKALLQVGVGHLTLGQPATELSGGEAQRIKLATELQKERRPDTVYILDEPTTGLHPRDADLLWALFHQLVDEGATVIVVEHDMRLVAASDWVIDLGPGAGDEGGAVVAVGPPAQVASSQASRTAPFLRVVLAGAAAGRRHPSRAGERSPGSLD